jgi:hypothetical protein
MHNAEDSRPFWTARRGTFRIHLDCRSEPAGDREVAMNEKADIRIDVEAAKALIDWKSSFANEVAANARRLVARSGRTGHVTLSHYRQAARIAIRSLSAAILDEGESSDDQKGA